MKEENKERRREGKDSQSNIIIRPVRCGVSKWVEDDRRPPALWAGHPRNSRKAVWGWATRRAKKGQACWARLKL
jgi:hypothetical protein